MNDWPQAELVDELLQLVKKTREDVWPLEWLASDCPVLVQRVAECFQQYGVVDPGDQKLLTKLLRQIADFPETQRAQYVHAAGDLLGLSRLSDQEIEREVQKYKSSHNTNKPKKVKRHGRGVRMILAARYEGVTINSVKLKEKRWLSKYVNELCSYLGNDDNKLVQFLRDNDISTDSPNTDVQPSTIEKPPAPTQIEASAKPIPPRRWPTIKPRRRQLIGAIVTVVVVAVGAVFAVILTSHAGGANSNQLSPTQLEARYDGQLANHVGCADPPPSQPVSSSHPPVIGPNGEVVGGIELRTSPVCPVIWARVLWNNDSAATYLIPAGWTLHVIAHRPQTSISVDATEPSHPTPIPYALSYMLATVPGCVYVEVYFSNGAQETTPASTSCVKP